MKDEESLTAGEAAAMLLQSQTNPPHRILVVEDDILIRQLNVVALLRSGYDVDAAKDGAAAWEALNSDLYDLMVTDNNMPKVSGIELLQKMRAARMVMPVILATGVLPQEDFNRYPWLQPEATLVKPYTVEELVRTVKRVLREVDSTADSSQRFMYAELKNSTAATAGNVAGPARECPAHSGPRILVVDENSDLCLLYAEALARPGYHVDAASDGAAAWEALQATNYDLLITENDMPNLTGVELVEKLRAARMALPVVMAAGRLPTDELARNPALQLAATLAKPFAVEALLETVQTLLGVTVAPSQELAPSGGQFPPSMGGRSL